MNANFLNSYLCLVKSRVTAIMLLLIISIPMLSKATLWFYFLSNRSEIAQTKCINKDIPESCCKGKCYLGSQLKKVEESNQQKNQSVPAIKKLKEIPYEVKEVITIQPYIKNLSSIKDFKYIESHSYDAIHTIFHPPEV